MIEQAPPELADGGYWSVVEVVPDPADGGRSYGLVPGSGCCAWYSGGHAVIRTPEPVTAITGIPQGAVDGVLGGAGYGAKPYGRVGGL